MGKFIFSILMNFFARGRGRSNLSSQGQLLNAITVTFKRELSDLIFKIIIGLVATGILIYSLINLGQYFKTFVLKYQYGTAISILFFSLLSAACIFLVFKLFYQKKEQLNSFESLFSKAEKNAFNFGKVYSTFLDGLSAGLSDNQSKFEEKMSDATEKNEMPKGESSGIIH